MRDSQIAYQLQVLFENKITKYYRNSYKGFFGKVQVEVLDYLYEYKEGRTQDVADALRIPKQHASKIILRLMELELVESKIDVKDKRACLYYLSEKGIALVDLHIADSDQNFYNKLNKLSEEDKKKFIDSMHTMVNILEKM